MALSNGISVEFLLPVPTSGQLNSREVSVHHTGRQWLVVANVRAYYLYLWCALNSYIMKIKECLKIEGIIHHSGRI